jgi:hypothetical protein
MAGAIAEIASMPTIKGVFVRFDWGALETTEGVYNFALTDQILATAKAAGKRVLFAVTKSVGSSGSIDYNISQGRFPAYLRDTYDGLWKGTLQNRVDAKVWTAPVMDRFIALHAALAARYDTEPYFEGIVTAETDSAYDAPDFSSSGWQTQFKRLIAALETQWPHTNVFVQADSAIGTLTDSISVFQYMIAHRMMLSGPDIDPTQWLFKSGQGGSFFQRIYQGLPNYGGVDYRGQIAAGFEVQGSELGGKLTPTASQLDPTTLLPYIHGIGVNTLRSSYIIWDRKDYGFSNDPGGNTNDQFWTTGPSGYALYHPKIKEFLSQNESVIPVVTTPPKNYSPVGTN